MLLVLLVAMACVLAGSARAEAGEFTISACQADRANYSSRAFDDFATRGMSCFYDAVLLDLGTGVVGPHARFAIRRADQIVLVTTPGWANGIVVLDAVEHLPEHTTVVVNKASPRSLAELRAGDDRRRPERPQRSVTVPYDERLAVMLDTGTYSLEALDRGTRMPIKQLGLAVAQQLV